VSTPSTNVAEKEIIFGGEGRLEEQIRTTVELIDGDLYVVISGCQVEMIGDDIRMVADNIGPVR
jgi:nitrogenase molybdenum-iron protein beta chain